MKFKTVNYYLIFLSFFVQLSAIGQDYLDSDFANNGMHSLNIVGTQNLDIQFQGDDNLIVHGFKQIGSYHHSMFYRLSETGVFDESFGENGYYNDDQTHVEISSDGWDYVIDDENNILYASTILFVDSSDVHLAVTKITENGILDNTFGNNGYAVLPTPEGANYTRGYKTAMDHEGRIIAFGTYQDSGDEIDKLMVARFNADGSLDVSFGDNGVYLNEGVANCIEYAADGDINIGSDNSIVVTANIIYSGYSSYKFMVIRLDAMGTPETGFGDNGIFISSYENDESMYGNLMLEDNSIIVYGSSWTNSSYFGHICKINSNGELDTSFGDSGYLESLNGGQDTIVTYYDAVIYNESVVLVGDILDLDPFIRSVIFTKLDSSGELNGEYGDNGSKIFANPSGFTPSNFRAFALTVRSNEFYIAGSTGGNDFFAMTSRFMSDDVIIETPTDLFVHPVIWYPDVDEYEVKIEWEHSACGNTLNGFEQFKIYKADGEEMGSTVDCEFTYMASDTNNHCYYVIAEYTDENSEPSETVCADILLNAQEVMQPGSEYRQTASGIFISAAKDISSVEVFSLNGNKVFSNIMNSKEIKIATSNFNPGLYFFRLHFEKEIETLKIIVK